TGRRLRQTVVARARAARDPQPLGRAGRERHREAQGHRVQAARAHHGRGRPGGACCAERRPLHHRCHAGGERERSEFGPAHE
ncbi:unnamed protein product, partial [Prorocentrum cordatum]